MIAGSYSLDLYCENYNSRGPWPDQHGHTFNAFPAQYTHELGSKCRQAARRKGWLLMRDGRAYCPLCSGKLPHHVTKLPSEAGRRALLNIAAGRDASFGLVGMSAHGGLRSTVLALRRAGHVDGKEKLTEAGVAMVERIQGNSAR